MKPSKQRYILIVMLERSFVLRSDTIHELLEPKFFFWLVPLSSENNCNGCGFVYSQSQNRAQKQTAMKDFCWVSQLFPSIN